MGVFTEEKYEDALARAVASGKLFVVDAVSAEVAAELSGYRWNRKTMDETWADPNLVAWMADHAVAVRIDIYAQPDVAASLAIESLFTIVVFRDGQPFDRVVGLRRAPELIAWLDGAMRGEKETDRLQQEVEANGAHMIARLRFARALASSKQYERATEEYAWLWQHVLEHEPPMIGVRNSYMVSEMKLLTWAHPPARVRFCGLRDALQARIVHATASDIGDWMLLNRVVGDETAMIDWFAANIELVDARPEWDSTLHFQLVPLLTKRGRWTDAGRFFRDPIAHLRAAHARIEKTRHEERLDEAIRLEVLASFERRMRHDAGVMYVSLQARGREAEARQVVAEIRRLSPGADTERILEECVQAAKKATS